MNQPSDPQAEKLPFGAAWQRVFVHMLVEDEHFAEAVAPHLRPKYLESEIHQWVWATAVAHRERYRVFPSWSVLEEAAKKLDPKMRPIFELGLTEVRQAPTQDADWVRSTAVDWIRRNVFVRAFASAKDTYNAGKVDAAYDTLMREMDVFSAVALDREAVTESWHFDDLPSRQAKRWMDQTRITATPTGIPELDQLLGGGLDLGQMGVWMSYSKVGKTTMLVNLGRVATRVAQRNVAHLFFEGSINQISNRYDASFSAEIYNAVKRGEFGSEKYRNLFDEYQYLRGKLYIRGFTDNWDYTVEDIWNAIDRQRRLRGWVPDVLIIDYADLIKGRGHYDNDYDSNAAAYRDLKTLSTKRRGYALWTAAQAKKPSDDSYDTRPHLLKSNNLGGRYEKVKVADFLGSMNATLEERTVHGVMRIWVEAVRDNLGGKEITMPCDFDRMLFGAGAGLGRVLPPSPMTAPPPNATPPALGYRQIRPGY